MLSDTPNVLRLQAVPGRPWRCNHALNPEDMASGDFSSEIEVNVLGADWWLCLRDEGILWEIFDVEGFHWDWG